MHSLLTAARNTPRRVRAVLRLTAALFAVGLLFPTSGARADVPVLATVVNMLSVDYTIKVEHFGTTPPTVTTANATVQVPPATDSFTSFAVNGSGGWSLSVKVRAIDVVGDGKTAFVIIKAIRGTSAPATLPVKVTLFFPLYGADSAVTFGYDTSESTAPAEYTGELRFTRFANRVDLNLTNRFPQATGDPFALFAKFGQLKRTSPPGTHDPTEVTLSMPRQQDGLKLHADVATPDKQTAEQPTEHHQADVTVPSNAAPLPVTATLGFTKTTLSPNRTQTITIDADALAPGTHIVVYEKDDVTDANEVPPTRQHVGYTGPAGSTIGRLTADFVETKGGLTQSKAHAEAKDIPAMMNVDLHQPGLNGGDMTVVYNASQPITSVTATLDKFRADGTQQSSTTATATGLPLAATVNATLSGDIHIDTSSSGAVGTFDLTHTSFLASGQPTTGLTMHAINVPTEVHLTTQVTSPQVDATVVNVTTDLNGVIPQLDFLLDKYIDGKKDTTVDLHAQNVAEAINPLKVTLEKLAGERERAEVNLTANRSITKLSATVTDWGPGGTVAARQLAVDIDSLPKRFVVKRDSADPAVGGASVISVSKDGAGEPLTEPFEVLRVGVGTGGAPDLTDQVVDGNLMEHEVQTVDNAFAVTVGPESVRVRLAKLRLARIEEPPNQRQLFANLLTDPISGGADLRVQQSDFDKSADIRVKGLPTSIAVTFGPDADLNYTANAGFGEVRAKLSDPAGLSPGSLFKHALIVLQGLPSHLELDSKPGGASGLSFTAGAPDIPEVIGLVDVQLDDQQLNDSGLFFPQQLPSGVQGVKIAEAPPGVNAHIRFTRLNSISLTTESLALLDGTVTGQRTTATIQRTPTSAFIRKPDLYLYVEKPDAFDPNEGESEPEITTATLTNMPDAITLDVQSQSFGSGTDQRTVSRITYDASGLSLPLFGSSNFKLWSNANSSEFVQVSLTPLPAHVEFCQDSKAGSCTTGIGPSRPEADSSLLFRAGEPVTIDFLDCKRDTAHTAAPKPDNLFGNCDLVNTDVLAVKAQLTAQYLALDVQVPLVKDGSVIANDHGHVFVDTDLLRVDGPVPYSHSVIDSPLNTSVGRILMTGRKGDDSCPDNTVGMKDLRIDGVKAQDRYVPFAIVNGGCQPLAFNKKPGASGTMTCGYGARFDLNGPDPLGNVAEEMCTGLRVADTGA